MKNPKLDLTPKPIIEIRQPAIIMTAGERHRKAGGMCDEEEITSPFWVRAPSTGSNNALYINPLYKVFGEKVQRSVARDTGRYFFVATALIAIKTVPCGINMQGAIRLALLNCFNLFHGDGVVLVTKVEHDRTMRCFINVINGAAAVIG